MRRPIPWSIIVAGLIIATVTCGPALREDEVQCEEAVAHLEECCPGGFRKPQEYCRYTAGSCGDTTPAMSVAEGKCIQALSCEQIAAANICERAANAGGRRPDTGTNGVCP
jgi:hypothetical protein